MFRSLVAALKRKGKTVAVVESTAGGLINAGIMAIEGSSEVYFGGSVSYNTKRGLPFLLNDTELHQKLLTPAIESKQNEESDGEYYIRSKVYSSAVLAEAFLKSTGTDYAVAEGGAAGPTFRPKGIKTGFSAVAVAHRSNDGRIKIFEKLIQSKSANRQENMRLFAFSAAEELLRIVEGPKDSSECSDSIHDHNTDVPVFLDRCVHIRDDDAAVADLRSSTSARFIVVVDGGVELICNDSEGELEKGLSLALLKANEAIKLMGDDNLSRAIFLGKYRGEPIFVLDVAKSTMSDAIRATNPQSPLTPTIPWKMVNARTHAPLMPAAQNRIALTACALSAWHKKTRFCVACGGKLVIRSSGHMQECEDCNSVYFPRQDPAVICVVSSRDNSRVLLGRSPRHPEKMFTALAGFVEAGETFEEAVAREVHEETGVTVDRDSIRYLKSQPWPFPQSSMIAFSATADADAPHNAIDIDTEELVAAQWFPRDAVAKAATVEGAVMNRDVAMAAIEQQPDLDLLIPPKNVVARDLIDAWLEGSSPQ